MTQGHTIETRREDVHVEVRLDGVVVASSDRPVLLDETGLPTMHVAFFPDRAEVVVGER